MDVIHKPICLTKLKDGRGEGDRRIGKLLCDNELNIPVEITSSKSVEDSFDANKSATLFVWESDEGKECALLCSALVDVVAHKVVLETNFELIRELEAYQNDFFVKSFMQNAKKVFDARGSLQVKLAPGVRQGKNSSSGGSNGGTQQGSLSPVRRRMIRRTNTCPNSLMPLGPDADAGSAPQILRSSSLARFKYGSFKFSTLLSPVQVDLPLCGLSSLGLGSSAYNCTNESPISSKLIVTRTTTELESSYNLPTISEALANRNACYPKDAIPDVSNWVQEDSNPVDQAASQTADTHVRLPGFPGRVPRRPKIVTTRRKSDLLQDSGFVSDGHPLRLMDLTVGPGSRRISSLLQRREPLGFGDEGNHPLSQGYNTWLQASPFTRPKLPQKSGLGGSLEDLCGLLPCPGGTGSDATTGDPMRSSWQGQTGLLTTSSPAAPWFTTKNLQVFSSLPKTASGELGRSGQEFREAAATSARSGGGRGLKGTSLPALISPATTVPLGDDRSSRLVGAVGEREDERQGTGEGPHKDEHAVRLIGGKASSAEVRSSSKARGQRGKKKGHKRSKSGASKGLAPDGGRVGGDLGGDGAAATAKRSSSRSNNNDGGAGAGRATKESVKRNDPVKKLREAGAGEGRDMSSPSPPSISLTFGEMALQPRGSPGTATRDPEAFAGESLKSSAQLYWRGGSQLLPQSLSPVPNEVCSPYTETPVYSSSYPHPNSSMLPHFDSNGRPAMASLLRLTGQATSKNPENQLNQPVRMQQMPYDYGVGFNPSYNMTPSLLRNGLAGQLPFSRLLPAPASSFSVDSDPKSATLTVAATSMALMTHGSASPLGLRFNADSKSGVLPPVAGGASAARVSSAGGGNGVDYHKHVHGKASLGAEDSGEDSYSDSDSGDESLNLPYRSLLSKGLSRGAFFQQRNGALCSSMAWCSPPINQLEPGLRAKMRQLTMLQLATLRAEASADRARALGYANDD